MKKSAAFSAFAVLLMTVSAPSFAQEARNKLIGDLTDFGLTYEEKVDRDTGLALTGASLSRGGFSASFPTIAFEEVSDQVMITVPDGFSISRGDRVILTVEPGDMAIMTDGLSGEEPGVHALSAQSVSLIVNGSEEGQTKVSLANVEAEISGNTGISGDADMKATYTIGEVSGISDLSVFGISEISGTSSFAAPEAALVAIQLDELTEEHAMTIGLSSRTEIGETHFNRGSEDGAKIAFHAPSSLVTADIGAGEISSAFSASQITGSVSSVSDFPGFGWSFESFDASSKIPLVTSSEKPFSMAYDMKGLIVSDDAWTAMDPNAVIDRSPGSFRLVASGRMGEDDSRWPEYVRVDDLSANFAGISLKGMTMLDFVSPSLDGASGSGRLMLDGAQKFVDAAEDSGTLPPQIIATARMGMAMFFNKGADEGLSSDIGVDAGKVTVNGIRIR